MEKKTKRVNNECIELWRQFFDERINVIVPNRIKTIAELVQWVEKNNPQVIEIRADSPLKRIWELDDELSPHWNTFMGIPIRYLKSGAKQELELEDRVKEWFRPLFNDAVILLTADMRNPKGFYHFASEKLEREIINFILKETKKEH